MFSIGVAGIMFEATTGRNRPDLIAAYVTMISLSVALRGDDIRRRKNGG